MCYKTNHPTPKSFALVLDYSTFSKIHYETSFIEIISYGKLLITSFPTCKIHQEQCLLRKEDV